jgi:hypothetical protein
MWLQLTGSALWYRTPITRYNMHSICFLFLMWTCTHFSYQISIIRLWNRTPFDFLIHRCSAFLMRHSGIRNLKTVVKLRLPHAYLHNIVTNCMFCWTCVSICACNGTNLMQYLSVFYSVPFHPTPPPAWQSTKTYNTYQSSHIYIVTSWWWATSKPETCRIMVTESTEGSCASSWFHCTQTLLLCTCTHVSKCLYLTRSSRTKYGRRLRRDLRSS